MKNKVLNVFGVLMLLLVFIVSLTHVVSNSIKLGEFQSTGKDAIKMIRIAHWQLEPGYREALERIITTYNALPQVKEARVKIVQMSVPGKFYRQWLNVHLMSGTAPDICKKNNKTMFSGDYTARYFEPLGDYISQPNPYNAPKYLPQGLPKDLVQTLSANPWHETFTDGMIGGWDEKLQDHYAVPTSFIGPIRLFYNRTMIRHAKQLIYQAISTPKTHDWFTRRVQGGYVLNDEALKQWALTDTPPDSLGRLLLCCSAIREIARQNGQKKQYNGDMEPKFHT